MSKMDRKNWYEIFEAKAYFERMSQQEFEALYPPLSSQVKDEENE